MLGVTVETFQLAATQDGLRPWPAQNVQARMYVQQSLLLLSCIMSDAPGFVQLLSIAQSPKAA